MERANLEHFDHVAFIKLIKKLAIQAISLKDKKYFLLF